MIIKRRPPVAQKFVPLELRLPARQHAFAKCLPGYGARDGIGCGATLMTFLDWQLHVCDAQSTMRGAMRGWNSERAVQM